MSPQLPPRPAPTESEWVEAELVRTLMRAAHQSQFAAWLVIPIYLALLATSGSGLTLLAWGVVAVGLSALRSAVLLRFERRMSAADTMAVLDFHRRHQWLWPATGLTWGLAPLLFFDGTPQAYQFGAWLTLSVMAMMAVTVLSSHLPTARLFVHPLIGAALAAVLWRLGLDLTAGAPLVDYWMVLFLLLFWLVLLQAARRQHLTHRRNFELQFRNTQLINSLTRETQAALNAVEIKNRFLASAAHDIRQPVHALQLYADWLANEPEMVRDIAPKIVQSTRAVNTLFDSLFDLVSLDSGHIRLQVENLSLDALLAELELQYQPLAQAKGLTLRVRHSGPLAGASVRSDPLLLRRIAGNLVSNAVKYTERGGVLVALRPGDTGPVLEVWDTGVGIAPVHQKEIFREFYKVHLHQGTEDGFGLGLYIVSRLCHILGHPVSLASRPGRGSVFRLAITPTDPAQAAARAASIQ
ncbi:MAG: HAMP domain-containing sensor histidine kinase [Ramlibacter sp.]|uniref:sensor histidine kinase n=1 Tax=Ramlibacter sp. TaxID=1917967 RepID=UPI00262518F7|nr:HAMP domain-containing sensor histidine kinase [Ramlibacter sp.]MDH4375781.1 HAMP domain-containing sensor histidine kinase [Ramlibacter sp.]